MNILSNLLFNFLFAEMIELFCNLVNVHSYTLLLINLINKTHKLHDLS